MSSRGWICRRVRCGVLNEPRLKKCSGCGGLRPKKRVPKHAEALREVTYEAYLQLNATVHGVGEVCAVCERERSQERRLDRDHDHTSGFPHSGKPRGAVCMPCNKLMRDVQMTPMAARRIAAYLTRVETYYAGQVAA